MNILTPKNRSLADSIRGFIRDNSLASNSDLLFSSWLRSTKRVSGIVTYFTAFISEDPTPNNPTQETELNQPLESGNIAPSEVPSILNLDVDFLTHTAISYAANTAWSFIFMINWNGSQNAIAAIFGKQSDTASIISLCDASTNRLKILNESAAAGTGAQNISNIIGKNTVIQLDAPGDGSLDVSINGIALETITVATNIQLSAIFKAMATAGREYDGRLYYAHLIHSNITALKLTYATFLRTLIPKIESVVIGSQEWATSNLDIACTPMGNVIPGMQLASDTEKITVAADRDFSSDTGFWDKTAQVLIGSGVCSIISTDASFQHITRLSLLDIGKWYKIGVEIVTEVVPGTGIKIVDTSGSVYVSGITGIGAKEYYIKAIGTNYRIARDSGVTDIDIDNVTVQEVGWAGLTDLYTWLIDPAGGNKSVANALKECAAWCHYNNDVANGAIYGKLYNWYAASLINTDLINSGFGWHVPTEAEFNTLATALGGASVAGGKMKKEGTDYWDTPNTGADNSSGFTALGGGRRLSGSFVNLKSLGLLLSVTTSGGYATNLILSKDNDDSVVVTTAEKIRGVSIRLIKD